MNVLTKIAIVFHVVISLLLAAGLIVFVNRTENFKITNTTLSSQLSAAQARAQNAIAEETRQQNYADLARKDRDTAIADGQKTAIVLQAKIDSLNSAVAEAQGGVKLSQVTLTSVGSALNASEAARAAQAAILDSTRKDNNDLTTKYSQSQLAISDLTNKLEVSQRLLTNSTETVAEQKASLEAAQGQVKDLGGHLAATGQTGLEGGAPPINAVVRSTRELNGIPYATISVGADAQVKAGMKFNVIDRDKAAFLGELTIEQVDEKQATGKLEGPRVADVREGTEVRTQL